MRHDMFGLKMSLKGKTWSMERPRTAEELQAKCFDRYDGEMNHLLFIVL